MRRLALLSLLLLSACGAQSPEQQWREQQYARCSAMGGNGFDTNGKFECYRHPIARMTKQLFTSEFGK